MENGDVLPTSERSYTHFEACEEDRKASDKEVENGSKENTEVYLSETHKAQTLLNKCRPIKLGGPVVAAQGKAVVAGSKHGEGKKDSKKYFPNDGWGALSADATPKPIESRKKGSSDTCDKSVSSAMKANTITWCCQRTKRLVVSGSRARLRTMGNTESTYMKDQQSLLQVMFTIEQSMPMKRQCMCSRLAMETLLLIE